MAPPRNHCKEPESQVKSRKNPQIYATQKPWNREILHCNLLHEWTPSCHPEQHNTSSKHRSSISQQNPINRKGPKTIRENKRTWTLIAKSTCDSSLSNHYRAQRHRDTEQVTSQLGCSFSLRKHLNRAIIFSRASIITHRDTPCFFFATQASFHSPDLKSQFWVGMGMATCSPSLEIMN